jgi:hypothetical protein
MVWQVIRQVAVASALSQRSHARNSVEILSEKSSNPLARPSISLSGSRSFALRTTRREQSSREEKKLKMDYKKKWFGQMSHSRNQRR